MTQKTPSVKMGLMYSVIQLYHKGLTYNEIGKEFGVSRQRIQQILSTKKIRRREINSNKTTNPTPSEILVAKKLKELGHFVKHMPYNYPYDMFVDRKIKIEVKYRKSLYKRKGIKSCYRINLYEKDFDFLVVVLKSLEDPIFYIFSRKQVGGSTLNIVGNTLNYSKYQKNNLERWDIIK